MFGVLSGSGHRSASPFCQGLSKEVRTAVIPIARMAIGASKPHLVSPSRITIQAVSRQKAIRHLGNQGQISGRALKPKHGPSVCPGFRIGCLRELDVHTSKYLFASNCQIGDKEELLPAFSYVGLYPIVSAPRL